MQRIYAQLDDITFDKIEIHVQEMKISRAKFLVDAINSYLHLLESPNDVNPEDLHHEIMELRTKESESWQQITKLKSTMKAAESTITTLQAENSKLQEQTNKSSLEIAALKENLLMANAEIDKWKEALKIKDQDIDYFKSHVAQLTQSISQFALKPGEEEIKKKGWWQFWR